METRRDVFQAIADPTRRQIIELIVSKPLHMNEIADKFQVTRQAVSLHVKILQECGLIDVRKQGRERYCIAKLDQLKEVTTWVEYCHRFWTEKFNSLDQYLNQIQNKTK